MLHRYSMYRSILYAGDDMDADTKELIESNLRLAYYAAGKHHARFSLSVEDAISCALYGLTKAGISFNPEHNVAFSSYAMKCMTNEMYIESRRARKYADDVSLDTKLSGLEDVTFKDLLIDPDDLYSEIEIWQVIESCIECIPKRHQQIIRYYLSHIGMSQSDLAIVFNLSKQRISSIINQFRDILFYKLYSKNR